MQAHRRSTFLVVALLALLATLVPIGTAAAAPTEPGTDWDVATIDLPNGAIGYDSARDQLLVAVSAAAPVMGNELVEIDPHTGSLGRRLPVGSNPSVIAVADDASIAYVGLGGAPLVIEVDLDSFTITRKFALGANDWLGPFYAEDIAVQPGRPDVIAVSRRNLCCSPRHEGVAVYQDGVQRPTETPGHTGADRIEWSANPAILYGYNNETTEFGFRELTVTASGVTVTKNTEDLISGFNVDVEYGDTFIHTTTGLVINPVTAQLVDSYGATGKIAVDAVQHKTFMHRGSTLSRFDIATRDLDWSISIPTMTARDLIDAGDVLAAADSSKIALYGPGASTAGFTFPNPPPSIVLDSGSHATTVSFAEIAASPTGASVYGVVRSNAAAHADELVEIDATTGAIGRTLPLGADPDHLAISDDGSTLLVAHDDANKLTQVDVATFTATRAVNLAAGQWGADIAARPGTSDEFAVVLFTTGSPELDGVILVRDGVIAPTRLPGHTGPTSITFAGDATRLYGHNGGTTEFGFYTVAVSDTGLTKLSSQGRLIEDFGQELVAGGSLVMSSNGTVVDTAVPGRVGTFASSGQIVPVTAAGRALVIGSTIREFQTDSFASVSTSSFGSGTAVDAVLAGDQVAVATATQVVFVPLDLDVPRPPGTPTGVSATAGDRQIAVSWQKPPANGPAITGMTASVSPGGFSCTAGTTTCTITGLTNGVTYRVRVTASNTVGPGAPSLPVDVTPSACGSGAGAFPDVNGDHAFCADVEWLVGYGLTAGYPDGGFHPTTPLSRQAIALFLYRLEGSPSIQFPVFPTFSDVEPGNPAYVAIEWLATTGLANGYGDSTFRPTAGVTRQSFAAMMYRLSGSPYFNPPAVATFSDVPRSHIFFEEIEWLAESGIAAGYADGTFGPGNAVSRQAAAAFLHRYSSFS